MAIDRGSKATGEPDIEEILDDLTARVERLRVLYEQYFMGIEKMEPQTARKEVQRKFLELQQLHIRNTGLRYRFNMLNQKFSVYTTYWNRTLRAIEAGTYYRDVARAGRHAIAKGEDIPDEVLKALPERMRAKIIKEREAMLARRGGSGGADQAAGEHETAAKSAAARAPVRIQEEEHADIDAAFDNLFGEAEEAVARIDSRKPMPTAPPAMPPAAAPPPATPPPSTTTPPPARAVTANVVPRAGTVPPAPMAGRATGPSPVVPAGPARPGSTPPPTGAAPRPSTPPPAPPRPSAPPPAARSTPPAGSAARPAGVPALPPGIDEKTARDLHKRFVQAKKLIGENADNIKYEHIVATIAKQAPAIMQQHNAKSVDFQVVVKDDKVILKATPKK